MQAKGFGDDLKQGRPTLYLACKLTGADRVWLDKVQWLLHEFRESFDVLLSAFDFKTRAPLGDPADVLEHDLEKVLVADIMVAIINGDSSDGRAIEIMERIQHGTDDQFAQTLILYAGDKPFSPMYLGFPDRFGVQLMEFDDMQDILKITLDWYAGILTVPSKGVSGSSRSSISETTFKFVDTSRAFPGTYTRGRRKTTKKTPNTVAATK